MQLKQSRLYPARRALIWLGALFTLIIAHAHAEERSLDQQAAELARLRADVERVHLKLEQMRQETQVEVRALTGQKANLSAEIQRARLRVEQLKIEKAKRQAKMRDASQRQEALLAPLDELLTALEAWTQSHLPYRQEGRLRELQKLKSQLNHQLISPSRALTQTWSWIEDEIKLSRESAMDRAIITLDGREVLADIIRIGMVMMVCRTPQGEYGISRATKTAAGQRWTWSIFDAQSREAEATRILFERFEQKVRLGFFWVPSSLHVSARSER